MKRTTFLGAVVVLATTLAGAAQAPTSAPTQPTLPAEVRLERDNLLLQARVIELETQLAALKAQLVNDRIGQAAPALIEKLKAAAPGWDVNPQTLELTPSAAAARAPGATPAPAPSSSPASPTPRP